MKRRGFLLAIASLPFVKLPMAEAVGKLNTVADPTPGMLSYHRPSAFTMYIGIDTDNIFKVGGWSATVELYDRLGNKTEGYVDIVTGSSEGEVCVSPKDPPSIGMVRLHW